MLYRAHLNKLLHLLYKQGEKLYLKKKIELKKYNLYTHIFKYKHKFVTFVFFLTICSYLKKNHFVFINIKKKIGPI